MKHSDMIAEFRKEIDIKNIAIPCSHDGVDGWELLTTEASIAYVEKWLITAFNTIQEQREKELLYGDTRYIKGFEDGRKETIERVEKNINKIPLFANGFAGDVIKIEDIRQSLNKMKGNV